MSASTFRSKPREIEAMQLPLDDRPPYRSKDENDEFRRIGSEMATKVREIAIWMTAEGYDANPDGEDTSTWEASFVEKGVALPDYGINYLEFTGADDEEINARSGDWIVKGEDGGDFYVIHNDVFAAHYEAVSE